MARTVDHAKVADGDGAAAAEDPGRRERTR